MRALVTGAAGFIGSNLCQALAEKGFSVVGLDDFSVGHFENLRDIPVDVIGADLRRSQDWEARAGKVDVVFHEAAITDTTVTDQLKMMEINVEAFRSLLSWAAMTGASKVVYASSAGVYGDGPVPMRESAPTKPLNVYAFSKRVMETVAAEFAATHPKISVTGLRYFNVFGPREKFKGASASMIWQLSRQMAAGKNPRVFEFGEQYRDFVYVKDVVAANLAASTSKTNEVFNVCTGKKTTFNEIIASLNEVMGTNLKPEYFKNPYSFYQDETLGDPRSALLALNFKASYSTAEGIKDYFGGRKASVGV